MKREKKVAERIKNKEKKSNIVINRYFTKEKIITMKYMINYKEIKKRKI